jgi:spindle assembly abnormal protein 6
MDFTTSVLSIVEMNEFNHVIHLSLLFRPGNDAAIKSYLSSSLRVALMRYEGLQQDHEHLNEEFATLKRLNREQMTDLRTIR